MGSKVVSDQLPSVSLSQNATSLLQDVFEVLKGTISPNFCLATSENKNMVKCGTSMFLAVILCIGLFAVIIRCLKCIHSAESNRMLNQKIRDSEMTDLTSWHDPSRSLVQSIRGSLADLRNKVLGGSRTNLSQRNLQGDYRMQRTALPPIISVAGDDRIRRNMLDTFKINRSTC